MFAIVRTGGKQYRVAANDVIKVEKISGEPGDIVELGQVLMLSGDKGIEIGNPLLAGVTVAAAAWRATPRAASMSRSKRSIDGEVLSVAGLDNEPPPPPVTADIQSTDGLRPEDLEAAMVGMLKPEYEEVVTGEAEVREVFRVPRIGAVAGCYVRNGVITRNSKVRFLREGVIIWTGTITSLRRFKDDVREVAAGFECGIGLENYNDIKEGDSIEAYLIREVART